MSTPVRGEQRYAPRCLPCYEIPVFVDHVNSETHFSEMKLFGSPLLNSHKEGLLTLT